ncbi:unnamed protein product [Rhizophagus irregularis]|uniref:Uncharacterized protein n=1 Tax=Rhizophagus irregularis TaxID=588596 RepID=A0A915YUI6_9GLOM|nr:unnamed protein product [Rhizophagus irregularis]CAB5343708.1 unnamed protein product [Rhizophagus irregularis]
MLSSTLISYNLYQNFEQYIEWANGTEEDKEKIKQNVPSKYKEMIKEGQRKRLMAKQGVRTKEEEEIESDSDDEEGEGWSVSIEKKKRGGKPGSRGRSRGGRRRHVKK